jgi:hypothetical protein
MNKTLKRSIIPLFTGIIIFFLYTEKLFISNHLITKFLNLLGLRFEKISFIDTMGLSYLLTFFIVIIIIKLISLFTCDIYIKQGINMTIYTLYIFSFISLILTIYIWFF